MARITKPLSAREVREAKPKDKEYNLYDGQGLHLRIKPSGKKSGSLITQSLSPNAVEIYPLAPFLICL
ncbi:UNVERIFIED_ORG: hypothetical protein DFO82_2497 [Idiomarina abyssalis]|uniref:hypothetical protein n=1 Tax=Idiomarina sp. 017G TaxID=2183988 RepID=UPI000E2B156A|nr:hypothetical protein [Idiomarina sp. 017G]TDO46004.1 hypothetical protein DEU30_11145 [Idiomarina sp. 017G]